MFEDFRRAWREAVDNFWREIGAAPSDQVRGAVYREVARARSQVEELTSEIDDCRRRVAEEREQAAVCDRREGQARRIGDEDTARIAAEFGARHRERSGVLARKLEALEAEWRLCRRDLDEMERSLRSAGPAPDAVPDDLNRHPRDHEFRTLEEAERERAAAERLDELKRRMGR